MSYILDALKKAESERALGSVPDIHAQPVPLVTIDGQPALWRRPLAWAAAGLAIALAALVWIQPWRTAQTPVALATQAMSPVAAQAPAPIPIQQPSAAPAAPASAAPVTSVAPAAPTAVAPAAAASPAIESAPAPRAEPPKPKPRPPVREKPAEQTALRPLAAKPVTRPVEMPAAVEAPVVAEPPLPLLRDLPANIQREIPALAVGGYIYASKPAARSILINNRLLREGEQIAPGLMLERMAPREAVLNYRGYRYRLPY